MYSPIKRFIYSLAFWSTTLSAQGLEVPQQGKVAPKAALSEGQRDSKEVVLCRKYFTKYAVSYQKLWTKRSTDLRDEHTAGLSRISDMTMAHCSEAETRKDFLAVLFQLINGHSGRVAVLLPLSTKPYTRHILKGHDAALRLAGIDPAKALLSLDTQSKTQRLEQHLAQAVFQHRVSAIIGGFEAADVAVLREWSQKLLLPSFIINKPPANYKPTPFVYFTHPTPKGIAQALIAANDRYRHKKISIMRPNDQHADDIIREYELLAKPAGITILHNVVYDSKRIDQMKAAARKLFKLEPNDRTDELKQLYLNAKEHAARTNTSFNPKMVALQPVVTQDAIMILDQFRNVRHMAKVFSYIGITKIPMFGHFEWRSSGLVDPFDPMFTGSYFVDVTGTYNTLPAGLQIPTGESPYFVAPDRVEEADLSLLGFRSMSAIVTLIRSKETPRRKLETLLPRSEQGSTPKPIEFDSNQIINWPTYLYEIISQGKTGSLSLKSQL